VTEDMEPNVLHRSIMIIKIKHYARGWGGDNTDGDGGSPLSMLGFAWRRWW
jgi:hypothetical protein